MSSSVPVFEKGDTISGVEGSSVQRIIFFTQDSMMTNVIHTVSSVSMYIAH